VNDPLILSLATREPAAIDWIIAAARAVVAGRGNEGLESAAMLSKTHAGRMRGLRDGYLRQAARLLGNGVAVGPKELLAAVERFRVGRWAQWHTLDRAPTYACDLEVALFNAFRCGEPPGTAQGLGRILLGN
jgi:hypothetical protein